MKAPLMVGAVTSLLSLSLGLDASAADGIGGGAGFDSESEFPFVAGIESEIPLEFFVQNLGVNDVEVSLGGETPPGISYVPSNESVVLSPGGVADYVFSIRVSEETPPGEYELVPSLRPQVNFESEGGSSFLPGIAGQLVAKVIGASADVSIRAENFYTGMPIQGTLSLFYADTPTLPVRIAQTDEPILETKVVPGNYVARFDVPGLQTVEEEFFVAEGEFREVIIRVEGLQFTLASAQPISDSDGNVFAAELVAVIRNDLARVREPTSLEVEVSRNGQPVETLVLAQYPEFPEGVTQQTLNYAPANGFSGGLWEFEFKLRGPDFVVQPPEVESFRAPSFFELNFWNILTGLAIFGLALLALPRRIWRWIAGRLRRQEKEVEQNVS